MVEEEDDKSQEREDIIERKYVGRELGLYLNKMTSLCRRGNGYHLAKAWGGSGSLSCLCVFV